mmetsp:Transcript_123215/g.359780  ORF Transcript_123215/g.359780 Transcript_123215/m.359780 type:complete len:300 (-) Transcript_123215:107-1006(-)
MWRARLAGRQGRLVPRGPRPTEPNWPASDGGRRSWSWRRKPRRPRARARLAAGATSARPDGGAAHGHHGPRDSAGTPDDAAGLCGHQRAARWRSPTDVPADVCRARGPEHRPAGAAGHGRCDAAAGRAAAGGLRAADDDGAAAEPVHGRARGHGPHAQVRGPAAGTDGGHAHHDGARPVPAPRLRASTGRSGAAGPARPTGTPRPGGPAAGADELAAHVRPPAQRRRLTGRPRRLAAWKTTVSGRWGHRRSSSGRAAGPTAGCSHRLRASCGRPKGGRRRRLAESFGTYRGPRARGAFA